MANSRFNITLSEELKNWYAARAESYGMSISGLMVMALAQYKEQQEAVRAMSAMNSMSDYIEQLKGFKGIDNDNK